MFPKCVFSVDLKEMSCWLSTFREGMVLELSVAEAAFLPTTEWTNVDRLVEEKKTGRVLVGAAPNVLHLVFKRDGGPWLKYTVLADAESPPPLPALAPLALTTDSAAEESEQRRVVKRKKKNPKRKRDESQAGA
eukprot:g31133.t1